MKRVIMVGVVALASMWTTASTADAGGTSSNAVLQSPAGDGEEAPKAERRDERLKPGESRRIVDVKFAAGTEVRVRGRRLVSVGTTDTSGLDAVFARFPGARVTRLFDGATEKQHDRSRKYAEARSRRPQADLNLFFRIELKRGQEITALVDALNGLDIVDSAAPEPTPVAPPVTPSFVNRQRYRTAAATGGIDADYAQTITGGRGAYAVITDVEYSWNRSHEDLSKARAAGSALASGTPCDPFAAQQGAHSTDHGTAVLGQISGDANAFGVTGLAAAATLRTVNAMRLSTTGQCSIYDVANAINVAANNSSAGDVILIEQQIAGPRFTGQTADEQFGLVPVEWDQSGATWAAIANATARGIIVVEAAGNGSQNLNDPIYNDSTGRNWFSYDSGAIMVGAGNSPGCVSGIVTRGRLSFSNYGSRLNLQGWGNCVTTTGYGALQGGTNPNLWYTGSFGGTSGASPIVASAAAILASIAEARGNILTPATVRSMLIRTGQPQPTGNAGRIGPLPNLRAAINALGPKLADGGHALAGTNLGATTVPVRQAWNNLTGGAVQYEVYVATDGGTFVKWTLSSPSVSAAVFALPRNHNYQFAARAKNAAGIWGPWAYSAKFHVGEYQENYAATNPAFTGSWVRAAWTPASDGHVRVSASAGSRARFTFTGSSVAWVATRATNRGRADVYLDGTWVKTVDLYSATTSAKSIAFSKTWTTSGRHTITIHVRGTAGRPKVDVDAFVRLQ